MLFWSNWLGKKYDWNMDLHNNYVRTVHQNNFTPNRPDASTHVSLAGALMLECYNYSIISNVDIMDTDYTMKTKGSDFISCKITERRVSAEDHI